MIFKSQKKHSAIYTESQSYCVCFPKSNYVTYLYDCPFTSDFRKKIRKTSNLNMFYYVTYENNGQKAYLGLGHHQGEHRVRPGALIVHAGGGGGSLLVTQLQPALGGTEGGQACRREFMGAGERTTDLGTHIWCHTHHD